MFRKDKGENYRLAEVTALLYDEDGWSYRVKHEDSFYPEKFLAKNIVEAEKEELAEEDARHEAAIEMIRNRYREMQKALQAW